MAIGMTLAQAERAMDKGMVVAETAEEKTYRWELWHEGLTSSGLPGGPPVTNGYVYAVVRGGKVVAIERM